MSFAQKVKQLVKEAPVATAGTNINFGPATFTPMIVVWKGRGNKPDKFTLAEYVKENGLKSEDDIELTSGKESFQLHIDIDVSALNPSLDFHYERDVEIKASNKSAKDPAKHILTSWSEIVHPSLEKVFGKDWDSKILANGSKKAPTLFVAAEAVDPVEPVKEGRKAYNVPKFIGVYPTLEACKEARDLRYPPRDPEAEMAYGQGEEETDDDEEGIPESVVAQAVELFNSTRKNKKQTLKMLEGQPFGEYDAQELLDAALASLE